MMTEKIETRETFDDLTHFVLDREFMNRLGEDYCRSNQVVLLGTQEDGGSYVPLGMLDVQDDWAAFGAEKRIHRKTRRVQLNACEMDQALGFAFDEEAGLHGDVMTLDICGRHLPLAHWNQISFDREQPVAKMVIDTFSQAVKTGASDIHIETYADDVDVRFRIDGVMRQVATPFSKENIRRICSHIKVLCDLDIAEHRHAQDGRISARYTKEDGSVRQIDLRVAVLPGPHGSDMVLRILDESRIGITLDQLGMNTDCYQRLGRIIRHPGGLILVVGPTASGKTTTLYAILKEINNDSNKILTVEDPIEYEMPRVNQKQVNSSMSFADYSRAFMRQNPDVLLIGEIRDEETAQMALRAAQMGHLVLATLHAADVRSAMGRLHVLCPDRSLVASSILGILSQRLVRRICGECREPYEPEERLLRIAPSLERGLRSVHGKGCPSCGKTGYRGQTGVFELLVLDDSLREYVWQCKSLYLPLVSGFRTLFEDALQKVGDGITTLEEVVRAVPLPGEDAGDMERRQ